jgi:glycosyltransferase involved in cell wall biosynthesis
MKITYFYRHPQCGFSIQRVFQTLTAEIGKQADIEDFFLPAKGSMPWHIIWNCIFAFKHRNREGINHITGEVYYLALVLPHKRTTMTIHDIGGIYKCRKKNIKNLVRRWLWADIPVRVVKKVTAISELTKNDLINYCRIKPAKIEVIENPITANFNFSPKEFNCTKPKILQIGTGWHKNLLGLIEAVQGIDCQLEIVGNPSTELIQKMKDYDIDYHIEINVSDKKIIEKYKECDIVYFASHSEGFGMIIIEAQAIGRPVITSNTSPTKEVAGEGAILVNPDSVGEIKAAIIKLVDDNIYRDMLIHKGLENIQHYNVAIIATKYLKFYNENFK